MNLTDHVKNAAATARKATIEARTALLAEVDRLQKGASRAPSGGA
jgi:hypothetical protein